MSLEFSACTKKFPLGDGSELTAIDNISFKVDKGEFVSVVGPSGCGKSTLLSIASGLYGATQGHALVSGEVVRGANEHVGFMLQSDLLLPWRNIISNVELGLEARNIAKAKRREIAMHELKRCHLDGFEKHFPYQLSGGMRQRAALARTLAINPEIILLDEPFSALDAQTKMLLQNSFAQTIKQAKKTCLLITHDLHEAVLMSDRIIVLSERPGKIVAEIKIDLPHRDEPITRRLQPRVTEYTTEVLKHLKLEEKNI